jgi:VanZ family protein
MIRKNLFSILIALLLLYLSLANASTFRNVNLEEIPYIDKIVHFGMYFVMMAVVIFEHRKNIKSFGSIALLAVFPLLYGILMEILQLIMTKTRSGDFYDALFDAAGIASCVVLFWLFRTRQKAK